MFHPAVEGWFRSRFGEPSEPQAQGWPLIAAARDTLISAPTGSGKTLAAFLAAIDALLRQGLAGGLAAATQVVYVSPLKALANDIHKNLEEPLAEIGRAAAEHGLLAPAIRVAVRSGDTLPAERQAMLRRPPHILVTTPESLYILLTSQGGRRMLRTARTVIVDEIHALAGNKRGAHLALSLERLEQLAGGPQRIGLSATVKPLEEVARFLTGARPAPEVVTVADRRHLDLAVEVPEQELGPIATNEQWEECYQRLAELARAHRSTLVFVSTRRMAERVAHRMRERLGDDAVAAHHGSLSRAIRLRAEERFKAGKLAMMVATASLELGLDIGSVDLVCQLGSPRQFAAAWQRVGRAGHWKGATPKGRFFALTRDDLIECAAVIAGMRAGELDAIRIPAWPRDILAQQIVAAVAAEEGSEGWGEDELFALARRAWPYRDLPRDEYDALLALLSEGISSRRGRRGAFLHRDGVHHRLRPRRGARLAAITCGGAIAETASYVVQAEPENLTIGSLDEDFAIESNAGDIILLGTHSWKVRGIETGRVRVEDAHGAPPTVPFWLGEAPGRTRELSAAVAAVRERLDGAPANRGLDERGAKQAAAYLEASRQVLGGLPTTRHLIAERFFDEGGGMQMVIHAPFGAAINKAWGMALRKRFCRGFDFELQAAAHDNGLALALSEQHSFPLETIFAYLRSANVREILEQAVLQAPIFQTRWRWNVGRALALLRFAGGRKLAPQLQRMRAEDLLAAAFPMQVGCQDNHGGEDLEIPNHPYVQETMRDCLHEFLDLDGLEAVLRGLESGAITFAAVDTPAPSPLAQEILNVAPYGFLDDAPLEERRSRAVDLRAASAAPGPGELDPEAVAAVCAEAWPQPESAEELHDLLLTLVWLPASEAAPAWAPWLESLHRDRRVIAHNLGWVAAERLQLLLGAASPELAGAVWSGVEFPGATPTPSEAAMEKLVGGWMEILGPVSAPALAARLRLPDAAVETALLALEGQGRVLRGEFGALAPAPVVPRSAGLGLSGPQVSASTSGTPAEPGRAQLERGPAGGQGPAPIDAWCERGLLARIHRRMVRRLRAEIEPVAPAVYERFLRRWQHLETGTRLHGLHGLQAVLEQLQGLEAAASAWERDLLPARVADYAPALLDQLCLAGEIGWARLTPMASKADSQRSTGLGLQGPRAGASSRPAQFQRRRLIRGTPAGGGQGPAPRKAHRVAPNRNSPITFFKRSDAGWLLPAAGWKAERNGRRLSSPAEQVLATLERRGACFFADLVSPGLVKSQVEDALWELVADGLATADAFDNLRAFLDPKRRAGAGRGHAARPRHSAGRWTLVREALPEAAEAAAANGAGDAELARAELAERLARQWLKRYGVIFKAALAAESSAVGWYQVLLACRRLEARGEIRGGHFVTGFAGEQYALPQAVESLRAVRRM